MNIGNRTSFSTLEQNHQILPMSFLQSGNLKPNFSCWQEATGTGIGFNSQCEDSLRIQNYRYRSLRSMLSHGTPFK